MSDAVVVAPETARQQGINDSSVQLADESFQTNLPDFGADADTPVNLHHHNHTGNGVSVSSSVNEAHIPSHSAHLAAGNARQRTPFQSPPQSSYAQSDQIPSTLLEQGSLNTSHARSGREARPSMFETQQQMLQWLVHNFNHGRQLLPHAQSMNPANLNGRATDHALRFQEQGVDPFIASFFQHQAQPANQLPDLRLLSDSAQVSALLSNLVGNQPTSSAQSAQAFGDLTGRSVPSQATEPESRLPQNPKKARTSVPTRVGKLTSKGRKGSATQKHGSKKGQRFQSSTQGASPQDASSKRAMRLEKNRLAARASREKRKRELEHMLSRLRRLEEGNETLIRELELQHQAYSALQRENEQLRQQLAAREQK